MSATATLTATGSAQTAVIVKETATGIVIGTVNAAAIAKKAAHATRKNAGETTRARMIDAAHTAATMREVVPAVAAAANVPVARQIAAHPRLWAPSCSHSANARPAAGMSMRRVMSSTRLCRRSKPVRIALIGIQCVCQLTVMLPRAVQSSWRQPHANSPDPCRSRSSAADASAYIWHGHGSKPQPVSSVPASVHRQHYARDQRAESR